MKGAAGGLLLLTAAACGGESPPAAPMAPVPEACRLLTARDVATVSKDVMGSLSSTLDDAVGPDPSLCTYALPGQPPKAISLAVRRSASAEQAADQQQATESGLRSLGHAAPVSDVAHLGDGAFWVGGQIDQLHVLHGSLVLIVTAQLDADAQRAAQSLAARVLDRLDHPAPARPGGTTPTPPASSPAAPQPAPVPQAPVPAPGGKS